MNKQILTLLFLLPAVLHGFDEDSFSLQRELAEHALEQQFSEQKMLENVAAELHKNLQAIDDKQTITAHANFIQLQEKLSRDLSELFVSCAPEAVKEYIAQLKKATEVNDEAVRKRLIMSAVLLYGKPGTGKSELAKAIADVASKKFVVIDCPNIATEYQNSGSQNLRKAIEKIAETNQEYIIILDEINGLINNKKIPYSTDDVGLSLGTQLDKYQKDKKIIFIATTNKPEDLPESLKSRFDEIIKIDLPSPETIKKIYQIHSQVTDEKLLNWLTSQSKNFSARDIQKICDKARNKAALRNEQNPTRNDFEQTINAMSSKIKDVPTNEQMTSGKIFLVEKSLGIVQSGLTSMFIALKIILMIRDEYNNRYNPTPTQVVNRLLQDKMQPSAEQIIEKIVEKK